MSKEFSDLVGEALGRASMAWSETPSGIFDSDTCCVLHIDIMNAHNVKIKTLQDENAYKQKEIGELKLEIMQIKAERNKAEFKIAKLRECVEFYACTDIYYRPFRDRNGMSGMSSMTDFELDDGEWKLDENGEKCHYCYGKRARQVLKELEEK